MRSRRAWYVLGLALIGWGVSGLLVHTAPAQLLHAARLLAVNVIGNDGIFAPLCVGAGLVTERLAPRFLRTPLRIGLGFAVVFVVLALPNITSEHRLRNPSVLPLDYEHNLMFLLGLIGLGVLVSGGVRLATERSRTRGLRSPK